MPDSVGRLVAVALGSIGTLLTAIVGAALLAPAASAAECPVAPLRPNAESNYPAGCRVYEKVSPADKGAGEIGGGAGLVSGFRASPTGDSVLYTANSAFAGATTFPNANAFFGWRQDGDWGVRASSGVLPLIATVGLGTRPIDTQWQTLDQFPMALSRDGRSSVYGSNRNPITGELNRSRPFKVDLIGPEITEMTPASLTTAVSVEGSVVAGSTDFSTVVWGSSAQLTPDAPASGAKLYVHNADGLALASILPDGTPSTGGLGFEDRNVVSEDGRVVYWRQGSFSAFQVMRRDLVAGTTVKVDASEDPGAGAPDGNSSFVGATPDGQTAFFVRASGSPLLPGAPSSALYRYEHSSDPANDDNLTLISEPYDDSPVGSLSIAASQTRVSQDGSTVYFVANGPRLTADAPNGSGSLYVWRDGQLSYIGTVSLAELRPDIAVSSNGRYVTFDTVTDVTGHGSPGLNQRFVHDADTGTTACASCPPDRAPSEAVVSPPFINLIPFGDTVTRRYVSDNGHVFFEIDDDLIPQDNNGVRDVYVYQDGDLKLITSGRNPDPQARFADASEDGSTVFFITRERLSAWDQDEFADLYAARIDGGLPEPEVAGATPCSGDGCQGPLDQPPGGPIVGSVLFGDDGNLSPGPAPAQASVRVSRMRPVSGAVARLRVRVPDAGRIAVAGAHVRRAVRTAPRAGNYQLRVALKPRVRKRLRRSNRQRLRTNVRIVYRTKDGQRATRTIGITFRKANARQAATRKGGR